MLNQHANYRVKYRSSNGKPRYQVLQSSSSVFEQGVENNTGGSGAVGLGVHQTFKKHEDQCVQLLLRQTLADDLSQTRESYVSDTQR